MSRPRITIVTPSYNQGQFIEDTIISVLDQSYPNLEFIILDGGSADGSREVISRYADHLTYWRSEPDQGQAAAIREGFEMSTGEILNWLNSDDLLAPGALHRVAEAWKAYGPEVVVTGGCQVFGDSAASKPHFPRFQAAFEALEALPLRRMLDMAKHWFPGEFFYQPEVFLPRKAYESVGGVDPSFYYTMDYDLWIRLALADTQIVVLPEILALYREHPGQKTADLGALHRQMVETANFYLQDERVRIGRWRRRLLAVSNRAALHRVTGRSVALGRRLLGV